MDSMESVIGIGWKDRNSGDGLLAEFCYVGVSFRVLHHIVVF
jgi:hypothetical protein